MDMKLGFLPFLNRLEKAALKAVEAEVEWFCLPAGQTLFEAGDPADAFYLVRSGALAAFRNGADGLPELVGHIRAGEPIGEMALVEDRPHSAHVYALRDCELIRLPKTAFDRLTRRHPSLMRELARMMLFRLRGGTLRSKAEPRVFALVSTSPTIDLTLRSRQLKDALKALGRECVILGEEGDVVSPSAMDEAERTGDIVILTARLNDVAWARQAIGRADRIWLMARGDARPSLPILPEDPSPAAKLRLIDIVLLHHGGTRSVASPQEWMDAAEAARCFHWRQFEEQDVAHLARTMAGCSVGLVLSGGGSRAYAHIGAIQAFRDSGIVFDFMAGTSMGAIIAAGVAMGWSNDEIDTRIRKAFVESSPLSDWTLPVVSLVRGKEVERRLAEHFGDVDIADLYRPFFCVSSNLTDGSVRVHRRGRLRDALRASLAIPGLLPPVIDGENVLVDGAVFNNFPVRELKASHRGANVGVDVTRNKAINPADFINPPGFFGWAIRHGLSDPPPIASLLMRAATAATLDEHEDTRQAADLLVLPEIDMDLREWRRYDDAIIAGYESTMAMLNAADNRLMSRLKPGR
ncbi:MAG: patatin-like phospholipase family protein [Caulobacterales bacterium]|uniref:patatin-like phospholipase family protein n=1 Tax=Glycocaulis sp. TaxID=1969725 RepID=UPI003FA04BFC